MTIPIKCVLVEWKAMEMGQYGEAYCATFRIGTEPHFDIPIWLPKETQEEDIIEKAHVMLHDLASRIADQTAGWKNQPARFGALRIDLRKGGPSHE